MKHDFSHIKTHVIRGRRFILNWRKPKPPPNSNLHYLGECESPRMEDGTECPRLTIWANQSPWALFWTMLHEVTHGSFYDLDETAVEGFEKAAKSLAKKMGFKIILEPYEQKDEHET